MPEMLRFTETQLLKNLEFIENMKTIAELDDNQKKAVLQVIEHVAGHKGPELKSIIADTHSMANPYKRIDNDRFVETEAAMLQQELRDSKQAFQQLAIFSEKYMAELAERTKTASYRAEQVREERAKKAEEAKKRGLIPFPDAFGA